MPKMKTHRGAAKRFRVRPSGRIKRQRMNAGHYLTKKSSKRKRKLRKVASIDRVELKRVKRLLGLA